MTKQDDLWDFVKRGQAAQAAADEAIARVEAGADEDWLRHALNAVENCAMRMVHFTTDDVWDRLTNLEHPPEPRALGAVMREAAKRGWVETTDRIRKSTRVACHGRPVRVWKSLL